MTEDNMMLRVRTVEGEVQVFVCINGVAHVIGGVTSVNIREIEPCARLSAELSVHLGGLGDR